MKKWKMRLCALSMTAAMSLSALGLSTPAPWADAEVNAAAQLQLIPYELLDDYDSPTSRGEFCKLVVQLLCEYTNKNVDDLADYLFPNGYDTKPFTDTSDKFVALCAAAGIVDGRENNLFDPDSSIQREEAAKMLALCASVMSDDTDLGDGASFSDAALINDWARPFVRYVSAAGIMNGRDENKFDPRGFYSRQESILTFYRLYLMEMSSVRQMLRSCGYPYLNFGANAYTIYELANGGATAALVDAYHTAHLTQNGTSVFALNPTQLAAIKYAGSGPYDVPTLSVEVKKVAQDTAVDVITSGIIEVGVTVPEEITEDLYLKVTQDGVTYGNWIPVHASLTEDDAMRAAFTELLGQGVRVGTAELFNDLFYWNGGRIDFTRPVTITVFSGDGMGFVEHFDYNFVS